MTTNKMSAKEFREAGYLQEINRLFLHPLGLALEVIVEDDGTERFGEVWDYRDDPEGIWFGPGVIEARKARRVSDEVRNRREERIKRLGYWIQPVPEIHEPPTEG